MSKTEVEIFPLRLKTWSSPTLRIHYFRDHQQHTSQKSVCHVFTSQSFSNALTSCHFHPCSSSQHQLSQSNLSRFKSHVSSPFKPQWLPIAKLQTCHALILIYLTSPASDIIHQLWALVFLRCWIASDWKDSWNISKRLIFVHVYKTSNVFI